MQPIFKTALCSFGMSSNVFHAPFLQAHQGFELYAVWERTKQIAQEKYPSIQSYNQYEMLLQDDAIDVIIVNTPNITHYLLAKEALMAGKHVIVEKPFTVTVAEAEELIEIATHKNLLLSVYHNRRWDTDFSTVKEVVEKKLIGEVVEIEIHFDRFSEVLSHKLHKETPTGGTGNLYDLGSHLIDQAIQLLGMPKAVFADIDIMRPISKVDDFFELILFYQNQRIRLHSTYLARENNLGYIVHGTKGSFIKPKTNIQELALLEGVLPTADCWIEESTEQWGSLHTAIEDKVIQQAYPSVKGNYMAYYDNIYQALCNNEQPIVTANQAKQVITIIEAAYQSKVSRCVVDLD